ncbi:MAG: ADP-ribosylglycohydrolase family protein [Verrucomicrobia bacterium]|nr:ADP-ribosylglycohydrolase family protein [Verrucomicrobiota bacterium]
MKGLTMNINEKEYLSKVRGCWMGKNIGGTVGAPFEWKRQINNVSFYTQDLHGEPLPNDDLDIQLLWVIAMEERGIHINARTLADYWCLYVAPHWAEYGTAKINMRSGLLPPLSGTYQNVFKDSCGAFIRSEIWACIAPGCPSLAAGYAYQDAILDHGNGEGTYAEVFTATLESAAFIESDIRKLITIGLSYIPADCGTAKAVLTAIECFDSGKSWQETRDEILRRHGGAHFFGNPDCISADDVKKGLNKGQLGYDVPSNIGILVLGLLYGGGDFDKTMCITVNCGEDTDCTGATVGSIFGIIRGIEGIPQRWIDPIGNSIKTMCLNLGDLSWLVPKDIDNLTHRTHKLAQNVLRAHRSNCFLDPAKPSDYASMDTMKLCAADHGASIYGSMNPRFTFDFFAVEVNYGDAPTIKNNEPKQLTITIINRYRVQANLTLHWYLPKGWQITPAADAALLSIHSPIGKPLVVQFSLQADNVDRSMNRAVLEITMEGRPTVMHVPIALLNGNVQPLANA